MRGLRPRPNLSQSHSPQLAPPLEPNRMLLFLLLLRRKRPLILALEGLKAWWRGSKRSAKRRRMKRSMRGRGRTKATWALSSVEAVALLPGCVRRKKLR